MTESTVQMGAREASGKRAVARVGVVGLGTIGSMLVRALNRSHLGSVGYDVDPNKASTLPCRGAGSAAEVASAADVVLLAVVNGDQARDALFGPSGIAAGARPGLLVGLVSTVSLQTLLELHDEAAKVGIKVLDTPVTRWLGRDTDPDASADGLVMMVGGDQVTVDQALPALQRCSKAAIHCGPLGAGMTTKLVRQLVVFGTWKVMYDAARFAQAVDVDYHLLKEVITTADPSGAALFGLMGMRGDSLAPVPAARQRDFRDFYELIVKDVRAAQQLAETHGFQLPMVDELITDPGPHMFGLDHGESLDG